MGYNGIEELKEHRWFRDFKWVELSELKLNPPFVPKKNNHKLRMNKDYFFLNGNIKQNLEYYEISKKFDGYYYNYKQDLSKTVMKKTENSEKSKKIVGRPERTLS